MYLLGIRKSYTGSVENWSDFPPSPSYRLNWGNKITDFVFWVFISLLLLELYSILGGNWKPFARNLEAGQFFCLFGVLRRFQHCTGHITTGSWKGRGNQYI